MRFFLLFLACLFTPSVVLSQSAPLPDLGLAVSLGADLFVRSGSTGMVMVVVRNGQVAFQAYGETAPGSGRPPTDKSFVRLCSLSKIFAADLLIKMAQDKAVRLDDPLQRFAPQHLKVPSRAGKAITLQDLATHTSGLSREIGNAPDGTPHFTYPDHDTRWRWLVRQHLRTVPGSAALYSNVGFDLLGDALQAAGHRSYAGILDSRTLIPLHMGETTLFPVASQCARLLQGAHDEGLCTSTEQTAASSGLYSTAADMAVWLKYLLGETTPAQNHMAQKVYVDPLSLESEKGLDHAGRPSGIGLGWMHLLPTDSPSHIVEKTGGGAGFLTYIALNQARHTAIFLAATDGSVETHLNFFKAANDLLLALAGLPPMPPDAPKQKAASKRRRTH